MIVDERKTASGSTYFWFVYLLAYLPLCLLPAIKYSIPYAVAGVFTMLPLFIVAVNNGRYRKILFLLILLGIVQGSIMAALGNAPLTEIINEPIRSIRYFVPCVLLDKVFDFSKRKQVTIWLFTTALIVFVTIKTLGALETDPLIARILAQGSIENEEVMSYRFQNVGGFGNCYALCLTFAMWVYFMFHSSKFMKIISTVIAIFVLYFTLQVQYMTMLLLCIVALLLVFLCCSKSIYTKLFSVLLAVFILYVLSSRLRWIASLGLDSTIYTKLIEFSDTLDGANTLADTTSRVNLYKKSLLAFFSNPIIGASGELNSHSTILGFAANSGVIGLFAYFYGVKQMYSATKINLKEQKIDVKIFTITFAVFLALAFVNPVHYIYEISAVLLFYIPLTLNLFVKKQR